MLILLRLGWLYISVQFIPRSVDKTPPSICLHFSLAYKYGCIDPHHWLEDDDDAGLIGNQ